MCKVYKKLKNNCWNKLNIRQRNISYSWFGRHNIVKIVAFQLSLNWVDNFNVILIQTVEGFNVEDDKLNPKFI